MTEPSTDENIKTKRPILLTTIIFSIVLIALQVTGHIYPNALIWGFHSFGFLTIYHLIFMLFSFSILILYISIGKVEYHVERINTILVEKPTLFLLIICSLFVCTATIFRVTTPLLGDNFLVMNNYYNTMLGAHPLDTSSEPLATSSFYLLLRITGTLQYPIILYAFFVIEIVYGIVYIILTYFVVRNLLPNSPIQILVFLFLLVGAHMQIFWGYLEVYSIVLLLISAFLLLSVLVIQEKVRFYWLLPAYTLLVLSHFLNLLLGLSVLLLCLNEWRKNGPRQIFLGMAVSLLIFLSVFVIAGFDYSFLFHSFTRTHILSINKTIDEFQAYTLFSGYHFLDLLNLLILLGPVVIFLLLITMRRLVWKEGNNTFKWLFLLYMLPLFLAFFIIKFDLSMAKDWDIAATFFWMVTVGALYYFGISTYSEKIKPLVLLLGTTTLVSIGWFQVNANEESSINRMKGIMDGPFMQRGAYYLSAFDLSMHFFHTGKVEQLVPIWKKYLELYPDDHRGYEKLVKSYWELGESGYDSISATYERWMEMEPNSSDAKSSYANFCLYVGSTFMNAGNQERATSYFQKCTTLNPNLPGPYNNLGLIYYSRNEFDEAMKLFQKAIQVNPQYARSYKNIADIHLQKNDPLSAIPLYQKAFSLDTTYLGALENLAAAYEMAKREQEALQAYRHAARSGSAHAQLILKIRGYSW